MNFKNWTAKKVRKLSWSDIQLIKLASAAFILMIAKLWTPILSFDWYWYLIIAVLASLKPMSKIWKK